jgi:hypothetical protein
MKKLLVEKVKAVYIGFVFMSLASGLILASTSSIKVGYAQINSINKSSSSKNLTSPLANNNNKAISITALNKTMAGSAANQTTKTATNLTHTTATTTTMTTTSNQSRNSTNPPLAKVPIIGRLFGGK